MHLFEQKNFGGNINLAFMANICACEVA